MGFEAGAKESYNKENTDSRTVRQRQISQEGIDKLVYDVMSSDNGLAQLLSSENLAGGRGSSAKTLMAQDFTTKIIGQLATITAAEVSDTDSTVRNRGREATAKGTGSSVICTELLLQGKLDKELHAKTHAHWLSIPVETKVGYWIWAPHVVGWMKKSERLSKVLAPIATSRCKLIAENKFNLLGALTIYLGQPICYVLGKLVILWSSNESAKSSVGAD